MAASETSTLAIWSLVLGILSCTVAPVIAAIPAIICGNKAYSHITNSAGAIRGKGMANAGLVMGYISIFLALIGFMLGIALPKHVHGQQLTLGVDARPSQSEIDKAVNWSLSQQIRQTRPNENLYETYGVVNNYREGDAFIYDYTANCKAVQTFQAVEGTGVGGSRLYQDFGNVERQSLTLTGSVTLIKKGELWYYSETIR